MHRYSDKESLLRSYRSNFFHTQMKAAVYSQRDNKGLKYFLTERNQPQRRMLVGNRNIEDFSRDVELHYNDVIGLRDPEQGFLDKGASYQIDERHVYQQHVIDHVASTGRRDIRVLSKPQEKEANIRTKKSPKTELTPHAYYQVKAVQPSEIKCPRALYINTGQQPTDQLSTDSNREIVEAIKRMVTSPPEYERRELKSLRFGHRVNAGGDELQEYEFDAKHPWSLISAMF